ncbi:MAG: hypothetical protein Q8R37_01455, partial [Nanoarchaeota archaeon]|nr:hypothetical protein [Nanoarchaeota archaeon]
RASWLNIFINYSYFVAFDLFVCGHDDLRGVRLESAEGDAPKNDQVPSVPQEIVAPTMEEILACLGDDVAPSVRPNIEGRIRRLYK